MIIISWDVGILHLAYCVLKLSSDELNDSNKITILDWDEINLIDDNKINIRCIGSINKDTKYITCQRTANYYVCVNDMYLGCCKRHVDHFNIHYLMKYVKNFFNKINFNIKFNFPCNYLKRKNTLCNERSEYLYKNDRVQKYLCRKHYKLEIKKIRRKIENFSLRKINKSNSKKYPTVVLQMNLIRKLDMLMKHFSMLGVTEVIIENQPSIKNPKMKAISATLFDYFMIRGMIDKIYGIDIKVVKYVCPSNKMKIKNNNILKSLKGNKKYKTTKMLSIQYTKQLLKDDLIQLKYLELYEKQDDLCDSYLQGRYYLEFIKNKG